MTRNRRLRLTENLRRLRRENTLSVDDLVYPIFVIEGENIKREIPSLKDQYHISLDRLEDEIREIEDLGIKYVMVFGITEEKDACGSSSYADDGIIQKASRKIKEISKDLIVITDLCMCEFTSHGHCGILDCKGNVDNDKTLEALAKIALSHAKAGADIICPSDMMDLRVKVLRESLDKEGYNNLPIMVHSSKFASSFYGPFRQALNSAPKHGDRKGYQMDFHNSNEALLEGQADIDEGADILIVKPAMTYLDIVRRFKDNFKLPIATYNVSGEYQMLVNAVDQGVVSENIIYECLISMKRAGADIIITYFAKYAAKKIKSGEWK